MISVNKVCEILTALREFADVRNENLSNFYIQGYFVDELNNHLALLADTIVENNLSSYFIINIDDELVAADEIENIITQQNCAEFELTFKKKAFIQDTCSGAGDIDEVLYCSVNSFRSDFGGLGLTNPLEEGAINNTKNTRIHVYQINKSFGGPKLAIVPTDYNNNLNADWLAGSKLPNSEIILKHVHIVSNATLKINPQQFELTWGDFNSEIAKPFRLAAAKQLFLSLCTNYYSDDKVELKGIKHIQTTLVSDNLDINIKTLSVLADCITWCYTKEDPSIPLQLVIDRLSLECGTGNLMEVTQQTINFALEQAKSNYKFVIAKRSDEYRKELKEIYNDIQSVTDKFTERAFSLASELLKSLLTIGFIFTVGTVSKAIVNNALLHSPEGQMLFKLAGIFLGVSFFVRWLNASADLRVSEKALRSWSNKLHNHISTSEVKELITSQIKWARIFYLVSLAITGFVQVHIAFLVYNSKVTLKLLGL